MKVTLLTAIMTFSSQFALTQDKISVLDELKSGYVECVGVDVPYTREQAYGLFTDDVKQEYCNSLGFEYRHPNNWAIRRE